MTIPTLSPADTRDAIDAGARLVDIPKIISGNI